MAGLAVGIDVGGTKVAAGLVGADGSIVERLREQTPAEDADAIVELVVDVARRLAGTQDLRHLPVGIGAAGLVDRAGTVRYAPNVRWRDFPLRRRVAERLGVPVTVDNDANVAAWAEYRVGAGREAGASMLMLTVGTGVGGGLVVDDRLVRGANGVAAEFGHLIVLEGGPLCPCGNRGCLEPLASGTAIGATAVAALAAGEVPEDSLLHQQREVTGKSVTVAAHAGDRAALAVLERCGHWLGVGIAALVNALDPEMVVLGGGAMQAGDLLLEPARRAAAPRVVGGAHRRSAPIVRAQLGDDAGLIGAALLALQQA